jgi:hypothetical protein
MAELTTRDAEKIAKKLGAEIETDRSAHDRAVIVEGGISVAHYGIRRGSRPDTGHDHMPKDLHITMGQCKRLSACTLSREQYVELLRAQGRI